MNPSPKDIFATGLHPVRPGLPHAQPLAWSGDGQVFYYTSLEVADGCGDFFPLEDAWTALDTPSGAQSAFALPAGLTLLYRFGFISTRPAGSR